MAKRPAFQFYPADWRKDTALQGCSLLARGLWHEMLCLMHECEPYGHLSVNGKPMKPSQIARLVGITEKEYGRLLEELFDAGVPSRTEDGCIYSRRMVRDEHIRNVRAEAGKKGGNPDLLAKKVKQKDKQTDNQQSNQDPTPSSSSSSSENPSTPSGVGGQPPKTAEQMTKDELWSAGKSLLEQGGMPRAQCGTFVGRLVKDYDSDVVIEAVRRAVVERPADPVSFLKAVCQTVAGERKPHNRQDAREQANRDIAAQVAAEIEGAAQ